MITTTTKEEMPKNYHSKYFAILLSLQQKYIYIRHSFLHPRLTVGRNARYNFVE